MRKRNVAGVAMATSKNTKATASRGPTRRRTRENMEGTTASKPSILSELESDSLTRPLTTKVDASISGYSGGYSWLRTTSRWGIEARAGDAGLTCWSTKKRWALKYQNATASQPITGRRKAFRPYTITSSTDMAISTPVSGSTARRRPSTANADATWARSVWRSDGPRTSHTATHGSSSVNTFQGT